jgi:hypothetical protein
MQFDQIIKRREFITLLGSAAAAWPLTARAQQGRTTFRIGYLGVSSSSLEPHYVAAFRQKLRELGHVDGENIAIEYRWAEGQALGDGVGPATSRHHCDDGNAWCPCGYAGH